MSDCYDVLGVARDASEDEIRKAYKRLVMRCHPDKARNSDHFEFHEVQYAYETLSDKNKRQIYDSLGEKAFRCSSKGSSTPSTEYNAQTNQITIQTNPILSYMKVVAPSTSTSPSHSTQPAAQASPCKRFCYASSFISSTSLTCFPPRTSIPPSSQFLCSSVSSSIFQNVLGTSHALPTHLSTGSFSPLVSPFSPTMAFNPSTNHLPSGTVVNLCGLGSTSNMQTGTIVGFEYSMGRYVVSVVGYDRPQRLLPQNIAEIGLFVHLTRTGDPSLDDQMGRITGFDAEAVKYTVQLCNAGYMENEQEEPDLLMDPSQIILAPGTIARVLDKGRPQMPPLWGTVDVLDDRGHYIMSFRDSIKRSIPPEDLRIATAGL